MPSLASVFLEPDIKAVPEILLHAKIWNFLVKNPGCTAMQVSRATGIPRNECLRLLADMAKRGVIAGELAEGRWA